ncbi:hypothetical protein [Bradyrhizobium vignae]|uniref:hypothetical protein n=1 Tax=Bradyrhizobium vignae TaxID=1549949 RepID=UPI0013967DDB|nr:hypothetical protein [Bradyrhizobium vignae]
MLKPSLQIRQSSLTFGDNRLSVKQLDLELVLLPEYFLEIPIVLHQLIGPLQSTD